jgi:hypothetical protein
MEREAAPPAPRPIASRNKESLSPCHFRRRPAPVPPATVWPRRLALTERTDMRVYCWSLQGDLVKSNWMLATGEAA